MNVAVVYCYPLVKSAVYFPLAKRFASTWKQFPPAINHRLYVVCNGPAAGPNDKAPFAGINCDFVSHNNVGWDIGAYQSAAEAIPCDLMVCLGAPVHFHKAGWLERMADAYVENGPNYYGCWAYLTPLHIRTTVFWLPPELMRSYPYAIGSTRKSRYEFEHGQYSMTRHVANAGLECMMVTNTKCFPLSEWLNHAPTASESLVWDQHINGGHKTWP